jgi:hypothetical protein
MCRLSIRPVFNRLPRPETRASLTMAHCLTIRIGPPEGDQRAWLPQLSTSWLSEAMTALLFATRWNLGQADAGDQRLKAWLGANRVEAKLHQTQTEPGIAFAIRRLERVQHLSFVVEACVDKGKIVVRDISVLCQTFQATKGVERRFAIARSALHEVQINQVSPERWHLDGKVWLQDAGTYTVLRLDVASGQFEVFEPYTIPRPNVYDVIPDSGNNGYFLVLGSEDVGRIDAKTGAIKIYKTPTAHSGPRRGMMDTQDRLWFGENNGDRIGMFDTRTERFQEWPVPTSGAWRYDVTVDRNGDVWSGGEYNDRILAARSEERPVRRIPPASPDERPEGVCRQSNDAGDVLGGQ